MRRLVWPTGHGSESLELCCMFLLLVGTTGNALRFDPISLFIFFSLPFAMEKEHGQVGPVFGGVTVGRVLPETWPILFNCILQLFHFES